MGRQRERIKPSGQERRGGSASGGRLRGIPHIWRDGGFDFSVPCGKRPLSGRGSALFVFLLFPFFADPLVVPSA
ncbi:MAG: hypothetical protein CW346_11130 [Bacillaceae bacterium]|nr:hypothetical protein [Bacillaceae bacterium]